MVYPKAFHKLVIMGSLYADTFNTTLSIVPLFSENIAEPSGSLVSNVSTAVRLWWARNLSSSPGGGCAISSKAILTGIKLNRIGPDGRYVDADAHESILGTPVPGIGSALVPAQLSLVATLRCPDERGLAGRGRMYVPPSDAVSMPLGADGRVSVVNATNHAQGVASLIRDINEAYEGLSINAVAGVASKTGAGRFQIITDVSAGRVVDTMRSRRNKLDEDPQTVSL